MKTFSISCLLMIVAGVPSAFSFQTMSPPLRFSNSPVVSLPVVSPILSTQSSLKAHIVDSEETNGFSLSKIPAKDTTSNPSKIRRVVGSASLALLSMTLLKSPAFAAEAVEHLHTGQKIANFFMTFGLPKWAVLAIISAMPVVELRGAVPVGIWLGMPITQVLPICVFGNMTPIVPLLFLLRNPALKRLMAPILNRAEKKAAGLGVGSPYKQWVSLAAFVGIPLPGTGAWTGAMGAFLLDMPTPMAISSIFAGVVSAGLIMSTITLAGRAGGFAAIAVLLVFAGKELLGSKGSENGAE